MKTKELKQLANRLIELCNVIENKGIASKLQSEVFSIVEEMDSVMTEHIY